VRQVSKFNDASKFNDNTDMCCPGNIKNKSTSCLNRNPMSVKRPVESALDFCGKFIDSKRQYKNVICRTNARITTHRYARYAGGRHTRAIKHKKTIESQ
jgi:hypothetical protein